MVEEENMEGCRHMAYPQNQCSASCEPLFVIGVMNRSGTNHLADLIIKSGEYHTPGPIGEDYLCFHAQHLDRYAQEVTKHWAVSRKGGDVRRDMLSSIGSSMVNYARSVSEDGSKRLLLRSPRANGVAYLPTLFPKSQLIVIVRDGRDVCASAERSWKRKHKWRWRAEWARRWNEGASAILQFLNSEASSQYTDRWLLVRFEDLVTDMKPTMSSVLHFIGVNPETYPWSEAENAGVIGSCVTADEGGLHWRPVEKQPGFNPIGRWKGEWSWAHRRLFKHIAQEKLQALGYADSARW